MALAPINTTNTGATGTTPPANDETKVGLAKLFNQIVQRVMSAANENANNQ